MAPPSRTSDTKGEIKAWAKIIEPDMVEGVSFPSKKRRPQPFLKPVIGISGKFPPYRVLTFPPDSERFGDMRLLFPGIDPPFQFKHLFLRQNFLSSPVSPPLLGQSNSLPLAFLEKRPLKLGKCSHHRQHQVGQRRIVSRESQIFFDESDLHPSLGQPF